MHGVKSKVTWFGPRVSTPKESSYLICIHNWYLALGETWRKLWLKWIPFVVGQVRGETVMRTLNYRPHSSAFIRLNLTIKFNIIIYHNFYCVIFGHQIWLDLLLNLASKFLPKVNGSSSNYISQAAQTVHSHRQISLCLIRDIFCTHLCFNVINGFLTFPFLFLQTVARRGVTTRCH